MRNALGCVSYRAVTVYGTVPYVMTRRALVSVGSSLERFGLGPRGVGVAARDSVTRQQAPHGAARHGTPVRCGLPRDSRLACGEGEKQRARRGAFLGAFHAESNEKLFPFRWRQRRHRKRVKHLAQKQTRHPRQINGRRGACVGGADASAPNLRFAGCSAEISSGHCTGKVTPRRSLALPTRTLRCSMIAAALCVARATPRRARARVSSASLRAGSAQLSSAQAGSPWVALAAARDSKQGREKHADRATFGPPRPLALASKMQPNTVRVGHTAPRTRPPYVPASFAAAGDPRSRRARRHQTTTHPHSCLLARMPPAPPWLRDTLARNSYACLRAATLPRSVRGITGARSPRRDAAPRRAALPHRLSTVHCTMRCTPCSRFASQGCMHG